MGAFDAPWWMDMLSGGAGGAGVGSAFGPWGTIAGAAIGAGTSLYAAREAKHSQDTAIQRRAADARAAGINPLVALGSVGNMSGGWEQVGEAGQNLGRAIGQGFSREDRSNVDALQALQLKHAQMSNDLLQMQLAAAERNLQRQPGDGPGVMSKVVPDPVTANIGGVTEGMHPDVAFATRAGSEAGAMPIAPRDISTTFFNPLGSLGWELRNEALPMLGLNRPVEYRGPSWSYLPGLGYYDWGPVKHPEGWRYYFDRYGWFD